MGDHGALEFKWRPEVEAETFIVCYSCGTAGNLPLFLLTEVPAPNRFAFNRGEDDVTSGTRRQKKFQTAAGFLPITTTFPRLKTSAPCIFCGRPF